MKQNENHLFASLADAIYFLHCQRHENSEESMDSRAEELYLRIMGSERRFRSNFLHGLELLCDVSKEVY